MQVGHDKESQAEDGIIMAWNYDVDMQCPLKGTVNIGPMSSRYVNRRYDAFQDPM